MKKPKDIDSYIEALPSDVQVLMQIVRATIRKGAPKAQECISYGMPAFKLNGKIVVYFAAWEKHIGFYALPTTNTAFAKELSGYKHAKGSIQFPLDKSMPLTLIRKMVAYRVKENAKTAKK